MNVFATLKERGFIEQCTDEKKVETLFDKPIVCYTGFDPTGDSLHVGHLFPIMALICFYLLFSEHFTNFRFTARITDHRGAATQ